MTTQESPIYTDPFLVLAERDAIATDAMDRFYENVSKLKTQYGNWGKIPNKIRTDLANKLRAGGWIHDGRCWFRLHNSITLSSL